LGEITVFFFEKNRKGHHMFSDIRRFVALEDAAPPTYMGFGIPMPPPEYQVLQS
jgi:hypothetical protein